MRSPFELEDTVRYVTMFERVHAPSIITSRQISDFLERLESRSLSIVFDYLGRRGEETVSNLAEKPSMQVEIARGEHKALGPSPDPTLKITCAFGERVLTYTLWLAVGNSVYSGQCVLSMFGTYATHDTEVDENVEAVAQAASHLLGRLLLEFRKHIEAKYERGMRRKRRGIARPL